MCARACVRACMHCVCVERNRETETERDRDDLELASVVTEPRASGTTDFISVSSGYPLLPEKTPYTPFKNQLSALLTFLLEGI